MTERIDVPAANAQIPLEKMRLTLRGEMPRLREQYGVVNLGIFGSYVRRMESAGSDLDLLVEIDNPALTLLQFVELRDQLSDLLGVQVDLVEKETLKPALGAEILREVEPV